MGRSALFLSPRQIAGGVLNVARDKHMLCIQTALDLQPVIILLHRPKFRTILVFNTIFYRRTERACILTHYIPINSSGVMYGLHRNLVAHDFIRRSQSPCLIP